ncbi:MAG: cell division protein FtsH, partial [Deltaproteobacteria bacterium]|nr:cell division protein FtsH [Deltaproteobacteria bacterium]
IVFNHFSTGAANDLKQATDWARRMVTEYGMSAKLGPVSYSDSGHDVFLGKDLVSQKGYSGTKAKEIDEEVASIVTSKYDEARELLLENRDKLDAIAEALLERETLERRHLEILLRGERLPEMKVEEDEVGTSRADPRGKRDTKGEPSGGKIPDPEPMPS